MRAAIQRRVTETTSIFRVIPVMLPGTTRKRVLKFRFLAATSWVEFREKIDDEEALHALTCGIRGQPPGEWPKSRQPETRVRYAFIVEGTVDQIDQVRIEAVVESLKKYSEDASLTLVRIENGSIRLLIDGTLIGFERLEFLFKTGKLRQILGIEVKDLSVMPGNSEPLTGSDHRKDLLRRRFRTRLVDLSNPLVSALAQRLVGQPAAINTIVPYIQKYQAGLCRAGRPIGVFLLLGPTGTGKTRTIEALAEVLHGSAKKMLKVDCAEFQMEHEVAKLIGAPPGYLGHRETQPMLTQQKLNGVSSEAHDIAIILFDEIEKAANSMTRLLLGVLDKATLRLGDNTSVNFEKTLIFMTTNLGAEKMAKALIPNFSFESMLGVSKSSDMLVELEKIGMAAVRRKFPPEFVNRIDATITYQPLNSDSLAAILDQQIVDLQEHIDSRLGARAFRLDVPTRTRQWLLEIATREQYSAGELKRTLHRELIQRVVELLSNARVQPSSHVRAGLSRSRDRIILRFVKKNNSLAGPGD